MGGKLKTSWKKKKKEKRKEGGMVGGKERKKERNPSPSQIFLAWKIALLVMVFSAIILEENCLITECPFKNRFHQACVADRIWSL